MCIAISQSRNHTANVCSIDSILPSSGWLCENMLLIIDKQIFYRDSQGGALNVVGYRVLFWALSRSGQATTICSSTDHGCRCIGTVTAMGFGGCWDGGWLIVMAQTMNQKWWVLTQPTMGVCDYFLNLYKTPQWPAICPTMSTKTWFTASINTV